jgi:hypothetical protein
VPEIVDPPNRVDARRLLRGAPLERSEVVDVEVAASLAGKQQRRAVVVLDSLERVKCAALLVPWAAIPFLTLRAATAPAIGSWPAAASMSGSGSRSPAPRLPPSTAPRAERSPPPSLGRCSSAMHGSTSSPPTVPPTSPRQSAKRRWSSFRLQPCASGSSGQRGAGASNEAARHGWRSRWIATPMSASKKCIRFVSTPTRKGWPSRALVSSARLYWHSLASSVGSFDKVPAPSAYSRFPADNVALSERWARTRFTDLRYYGTPARGRSFRSLRGPFRVRHRGARGAPRSRLSVGLVRDVLWVGPPGWCPCHGVIWKIGHPIRVRHRS